MAFRFAFRDGCIAEFFMEVFSLKNTQLRALTECALLTALALALSYLEIPIGFAFGGFGGSVSLAMLPMVLCALRWGTIWGLGSGFVMGTLKFIFAGSGGYTLASILLDYSVAYMAVGLAGVVRGRANMAWLGALVGCLGRFFVHFVSGVTVYAAYVGPIFGWSGNSAAIYSILYNGSYMLPNTVLTVLLVLLLQKPLKRLIQR